MKNKNTNRAKDNSCEKETIGCVCESADGRQQQSYTLDNMARYWSDCQQQQRQLQDELSPSRRIGMQWTVTESFLCFMQWRRLANRAVTMNLCVLDCVGILQTGTIRDRLKSLNVLLDASRKLKPATHDPSLSAENDGSLTQFVHNRYNTVTSTVLLNQVFRAWATS